MNFVVEIPRTLGDHDSIWVVVDRIAKSSYFLVMKTMYKIIHLARLSITKIVLLHGVLYSIIFDWDQKFTLRFWKTF